MLIEVEGAPLGLKSSRIFRLCNFFLAPRRANFFIYTATRCFVGRTTRKHNSLFIARGKLPPLPPIATLPISVRHFATLSPQKHIALFVLMKGDAGNIANVEIIIIIFDKNTDNERLSGIAWR